ncbi:hypothetical protein ElyMa_001300300 [Elysia marginata]|uniref:Mos1 transposase HTH domain-containing protein n=1 Tax=Elysia marginata TaxID=1093978 RepID=A0AAV4IJY6_9GAST|nr:hypothetical protein ElyMa_001300300 [Elysia marginata]
MEQYGDAWKVVNQVSGRKRAKEGQVSGSSPEEIVTTWFTHFQKLLGEPQTVEDPDEEIPSVYGDLDINDETFTLDDLKIVSPRSNFERLRGQMTSF